MTNARQDFVAFQDLGLFARFTTAYGSGNVYVKTSDTEAGRVYCRGGTVFAAPMRAEELVKPFRPDEPAGEYTVLPRDTTMKGRLLGYVTVDDTVTHRETYETAAWFRDHKIEPGIYPVYANGIGLYGAPIYYAEFNTTVTDACLVSLFGGVRYGADNAGKREIGTSARVRLGGGWYDSAMELRAPFEGRAGFTFAALVEDCQDGGETAARCADVALS